MTVSLNYNEQMIRKAQDILEQAQKLPHYQRDQYCRRYYNLSYRYLSELGGRFEKPSTRVIHTLGFEIWIKDLATGEMSPMEMNIKWDGEEMTTKTNLASTAVSVIDSSEFTFSKG